MASTVQAIIAGVGRLDALFAGDEGAGLLALLLHHPVVDLAREQAQRQADHPRAVRKHALDGEVGLAGVGGAENGPDTRCCRWRPGAALLIERRIRRSRCGARACAASYQRSGRAGASACPSSLGGRSSVLDQGWGAQGAVVNGSGCGSIDQRALPYDNFVAWKVYFPLRLERTSALRSGREFSAVEFGEDEVGPLDVGAIVSLFLGRFRIKAGDLDIVDIAFERRALVDVGIPVEARIKRQADVIALLAVEDAERTAARIGAASRVGAARGRGRT